MPVTALEEQYEIACNRSSDICGHLRTFYSTVVDIDAKVVLELGSRWGESTKAWLAGLERTGGRLVTVDLIERPDIQGDGIEWEHVQGDDLTPSVVHAVEGLTLPEVDILFIDTSHEYWRTRAELECYGQLVRPDGYIFLHDTELQPVMTAITEYVAAPGERAVIESINPTCNGLGTLRRTDQPGASSYR